MDPQNHPTTEKQTGNTQKFVSIRHVTNPLGSNESSCLIKQTSDAQ